ncbi:MAG: hypothetical protein R2830_01420 [Saprospiraceae bacterium]
MQLTQNKKRDRGPKPFIPYSCGNTFLAFANSVISDLPCEGASLSARGQIGKDLPQGLGGAFALRLSVPGFPVPVPKWLCDTLPPLLPKQAFQDEKQGSGGNPKARIAPCKRAMGTALPSVFSTLLSLVGFRLFPPKGIAG